ncbi:ATP-binding cassette domain-containing protein, partial [Pyrinomonas sp.]|uniref:ATP-binding cassette domain-containing protein n=1 Tax=Pyrinomonas sp. TaxID=2080306 RepID=UPI00331A3400
LMGRLPHARSARRDLKIAQAALELVEAAHLADRRYTTLSGGERQRVQLARVLAQIWEGSAPRYLLLDEPTSSLDLAHQQATMRIARLFARRGVGVVTVLHDLNLAAQHADRIIVLSAGERIASGPAYEALTLEIIRRVFGVEAITIAHPGLRAPFIAPCACADEGANVFDRR